MKTMHLLAFYTMVLLVLVFIATTLKLAIRNNELETTLQSIYIDLEGADKYWTEKIGDYQLDVINDTITVRDEDRTLGKFLWEDKSPLGSIILKDSE